MDTVVEKIEYIIHKYSTVRFNSGKLVKKYYKTAKSSFEFNQFPDFAREIAREIHDTILIDSVVYPFEDRLALLNLLRQHIANHIIKVEIFNIDWQKIL